MVLPVFNLAASPAVQTLTDDFRVLIVDNALANPGDVIEYAAAHIDTFRINMRNKYPGPEQELPAEASLAAREFLLKIDAPAKLGLGAALPGCFGRISVATQSPETLTLPQRICHTDDHACPPGLRPVAAVLYLFENPSLGGTGFYRYRDDIDFMSIAKDWQRADTKERAELANRFPFFTAPPSFLTASNEFVEQLLVIPAVFNRMLVYRGDLPHVPHLPHPEQLTRNPRRGRLSLNFFMRCQIN